MYNTAQTATIIRQTIRQWNLPGTNASSPVETKSNKIVTLLLICGSPLLIPCQRCWTWMTRMHTINAQLMVEKVRRALCDLFDLQNVSASK